LLLSPLSGISDREIARTLLLIHTFMDTAVLLVLLKFAQEIFADSKYRWMSFVASAIIIFQPFTATMVSSVYTEQFCQFLIFFGVLFLTRYALSKNSVSFGLFGALLLGISSILRVELLLLNIMILLFCVILTKYKHRDNISIFRILVLYCSIYSIFPLFMAGFQYVSTGELGFVKPVHRFDGYNGWTRTWFMLEKTDHDRFQFGKGTPTWEGFNAANYPARAFDSSHEVEQLTHLLNRWRIEGYDDEIDQQLEQIAANKARQNPLRHYLLIPIARMLHFWVNIDGAQTFLRSVVILPPFSTVIVAVVMILKSLLLIAAAVGFYIIWLCKERISIQDRDISFARLASIAVLARTVELGVLGIFLIGGLMEVRYVVIVYPFVLLLSLFGFRYGGPVVAGAFGSRH